MQNDARSREPSLSTPAYRHRRARSRLLTTRLAMVSWLLLLWSIATPWAAGFPNRPDHYKVTLFGVWHIADMTPTATQTRCGWNDAEPECLPAPNGSRNYVFLSNARWFVFASLLLLAAGVVQLWGRSLLLPPMTMASAAICTVIAAILVVGNVEAALAVFAGARVSTSGSGIIAATIAALLALAAAGVSGFVRPAESRQRGGLRTMHASELPDDR